MNLSERLDVLARLGDHLSGPEDERLTAHQKRTEYHNAWLTPENQRAATRAIAEMFLDREKLENWAAGYPEIEKVRPVTVGLVLAGNIPLVGFHDVLCVFAAGHRAQIKLSSKDPYVLPYLVKLLIGFDARAADYFDFVNVLKGYDAVIATGSNNSARYFEAYFGKVPHVIRRNRSAVAVLNGRETEEELRALGHDVFTYFGLGCRNVSKIYVPEDYDFQPLLEVFHDWKHYQNFTKWKNNFDYNYALLMLNKEQFLSNGALILREATPLVSHIAGLYYETYADPEKLATELTTRLADIQLVVAAPGLLPTLKTFAFGEAQHPGLEDYADGVDTMAFLTRSW